MIKKSEKRTTPAKTYDKLYPCQHNAVISKDQQLHLQQRDEAIQTIAVIGRAEWKKQEHYHR